MQFTEVTAGRKYMERIRKEREPYAYELAQRLMVHDMFRKARAAVPVERDDGQMVTLHFSQETAGTHQGQKETLGTWMPRRHVACASNDEQSYSRR